jgi:hypothetical protein
MRGYRLKFYYQLLDLLARYHSDLAGTALVVITAGANARGRRYRLPRYAREAEVPGDECERFEEIVPEIRSAAPETLILVFTGTSPRSRESELVQHWDGSARIAEMISRDE